MFIDRFTSDLIIKLSSYKIWAFNPINNAAEAASASDPPVRMGFLSVSESGLFCMNNTVLLYYHIQKNLSRDLGKNDMRHDTVLLDDRFYSHIRHCRLVNEIQDGMYFGICRN